ncbi:hypothetical protein BJF78_23630 [Pseudonocardia sp. CNS-139]|nr:hypothetical protein BJF78_23630 [Pseudonocardia sp. CNS-139]
MSARQAALVNGVAGHALDFDDMGLGGIHPSVAVVPAVLALAERIGAGGRRTCEALLAGYDAMGWISHAAGWSAYRRGFHATGTVGAFGAAVACARLIGLDREGYVRALGLAAMQAAGLKISFGSMAKHLNAGKAAANGLLAADLAARGFTAPDDAIEGHQGFVRTHGDPQDFDLERARTTLGEENAVTQVLFKFHASCGGTHAAIESVRAALGDDLPALDDVAGVDVAVAEDLLDMCAIPEPRTGLEGKFSLRHATALVLAGRGTGPAGFTDEAVSDPVNVRARGLVRITPSTRLSVGGAAEVVVTFADGRRRTASVDPYVPIPAAEVAGRHDAFAAKFTELATPTIGARRAREAIDVVAAIESLDDIGELTALARP